MVAVEHFWQMLLFQPQKERDLGGYRHGICQVFHAGNRIGEKMKEIKIAIPENGEMFAPKVDDLHAELLKLPAYMYVDLFHMMKNKMDDSYYVSNGFISANAACRCSSIV